MPFKCTLRECLTGKNRVDEKGKQQTEQKRPIGLRSHHVTPEESSYSYPFVQQSPWANVPPELLHDIIVRVDANETTWPARRAVISCAAVCKSWREITMEAIRTPEECGLLTFPKSLKQPGPRDSPIQCFIRRERATSTYRLYLGLSPALISGDASKFLLGAKRIRKVTKTDFPISMSADDFSRSSNSYLGNLRFLSVLVLLMSDELVFGVVIKHIASCNRSNFFGSKFFIYDCLTLSNSEIPSNGRSRKRISTKKVSPRFCNIKVATISYELNVLRTRGPRRMHCTIHTIPVTEISTTSFHESKESIGEATEPLVLRKKTPRWHEQLQCWCLNFRGRVTVASVKNFQLVAAVESSQNVPVSEQEKVILQFGKIGKDIFTMDYQYPLSAFQDFAICLSSFDTKPACE
ncbi:tubby-like F-box protein 2 isoform X1 [Primulina eburnea]|uniref:tubby-like F-box protein 2 isoform X1 n=1 Tax=Primulina eburnea TaxID=1245227 RepID=UPI003C6C065F